MIGLASTKSSQAGVTEASRIYHGSFTSDVFVMNMVVNCTFLSKCLFNIGCFGDVTFYAKNAVVDRQVIVFE